MPIRVAYSGFAEIIAMHSYLIQSSVSTDEACSARQAGISLNFLFVVHRLLECNIPMQLRIINFICKTMHVCDGFFPFK
jgi:hypothetical protein